jgi:hypothetical protein
LDPAAVQAKLAEAYGDQPWMPVAEVPAEGFTGTWYGLKSFAVPGDLAVDAPGHWAK